MDYVRSLTSMIDVCLTLEPGFSTLEDLAFLDYANSVHLLGSVHSPKDIEAIKEFSRSLIWFTYRKNWPAPIGGFDGPTSDRGWGCMIRVGQMVLAQALLKLHLGTDWRWSNELAKRQEDNEQFQAYQRLLRMFQDKRTAQFSIHQIAQFGVLEGKSIGEWLGPNSMAQVLKRIIVYDEWSNLVVHVAMDNVLISDDVRMMASLPHKNQDGAAEDGNGNNQNAGNDSQWNRPLLLIVPLRLGLTAINPCYFNAVVVSVPFFTGKKLLYLDPHICQEFTDIDAPPAQNCDLTDDDDDDNGRLAGTSSTSDNANTNGLDALIDTEVLLLPPVHNYNQEKNGKLLEDDAPNGVASSLRQMEFPSPCSAMDTSVLDDYLRHHRSTTSPSSRTVDEGLFLPPLPQSLLLSASPSSSSSSLNNQHNQGEGISFPTTSSSVSKISSRSGCGGGADSLHCSSTASEPGELSSSVERPMLDSFIESFADVITLTQQHQHLKDGEKEKWTECSSTGGTNERLDDDEEEVEEKRHYNGDQNGGHASSPTFEKPLGAEMPNRSSVHEFDDTSFHCPYILTMDFKTLDPSLALGFLTRNLEEYKDLVHRLKTSVLPSSSPPLFEILDSRPKGWPKFTPFESDFFRDDPLNIKEYDLEYDIYANNFCHYVHFSTNLKKKMAPSAKKKRPNNSTISSDRRQSPAGPTGSVITFSGTRRSARIAGKKKKPIILRQIIICDDVWLSIFPFLGPAEVGLKLAMLSYRFDGLADTHFKTRKWTFGEMEILRPEGGVKRKDATIFKRIEHARVEWLPIQQGPPPGKLAGFNEITIRYIDHTVIDFLRRFQHHLFNMDINLMLNIYGNRCCELVAQHVWPLFKSKVNKMELNSEILSKLCTHISPTVLRDCANLRSIRPPVSTVPCDLGDDHHEASGGQALAKWLHTPRDDGRPKVLKYFYQYNLTAMVETLKQEFCNAYASVNYIIVVYLHNYDQFVPFALENEQTREQLAFQRVQNSTWLLKRAPIARDEHQKWAEWEREAIDRNWKKNVINIQISDSSINCRGLPAVC
uniref:Peptidase C54 catalytic domain-containing protein n=1 Tax=Globodera rostochiensis TaxID=31243 RepID=A0A914HDJ4_GLORO